MRKTSACWRKKCQRTITGDDGLSQAGGPRQAAAHRGAALLKMQPGQVSDIIQVEQAYTILRLVKHVPAGK